MRLLVKLEARIVFRASKPAERINWGIRLVVSESEGEYERATTNVPKTSSCMGILCLRAMLSACSQKKADTLEGLPCGTISRVMNRDAVRCA